MKYVRMPIEIESPEQMGYSNLKYNLTESSFSDFKFKDLNLNLNELILCYGDHVGNINLRKLIAKSAADTINENNVLVTAGAATALFIIATSLLEPNEEIVVMRPNYATNIETPRAIGAKIKFIDLKFEDQWLPNLNDIKSKISKNTKLLSITTPHNPTGAVLPKNLFYEIINLCEENNIYLLCDETYRDMSYVEKLPSAASISKKAISVCSLSKTFGLPGIRIGWLITQDENLFEKFLAAKEQIMICNSVLDEEVAKQFMQNKDSIYKDVMKKIKKHFEIVSSWIQSEPKLEWVEPQGGVVCFPRIKKTIKIDLEKFYKTLNSKHGTFVGPGHWFEQEKIYMRIGFGWPTTDELKAGLECISRALDESVE
jgi:aspartate/methionine/tyrosine aminotransferase